MKKIMIALAILGFTWSGAQAQTNKCICPSKTAKAHKVAHVARQHAKPVNTASTLTSTHTYQVCREQGGYYTCCLYKNITTTPVSAKPLAVK